MLIIRYLILTVIAFNGTDKLNDMPRFFDYPTASALTGNEYLVIDQNGQTSKLTPDDLCAYCDSFNAGENADTYVNWQGKKAAGTLPAGEFIEITDKADLGIVLYCVSANQFSLSGTGGFLNADFQTAGVYTGIAGYAGWLGQWHSGLAAVAINKVAIYNGLHYKNLTGAVGTAPSGDAVNWVVLSKVTANVGYIQEWDAIEYDFDNDYVNSRTDKRSNCITDNILAGGGGLALFQWGNDSVFLNHIPSGNGTISCLNNLGTISGNVVMDNALITATTNAGVIASNLLINAGITANLNSGVAVQNCIFSNIVATLNVAVAINGKRCQSGFSNIPCTISITGLTTLNITAANNYCGVINLTSANATETLTDITNFPSNHPFTIYPASNITALTLTGDPSPTAAGKIALAAASLVLNGSKGDWCEFQVARLATNYVEQKDAMNIN